MTQNLISDVLCLVVLSFTQRRVLSLKADRFGIVEDEDKLADHSHNNVTYASVYKKRSLSLDRATHQVRKAR